MILPSLVSPESTERREQDFLKEMQKADARKVENVCEERWARDSYSPIDDTNVVVANT